jgi:hypothetical protein
MSKSMLTIRKEQYAVLQKVELEKFVGEACGHLRQFFPDQFGALGETKVRELIHFAAQRSVRYGIAAKADVLKYIDLMILFGQDFDTDEHLKWANQILNSENPSVTKVEMLITKAKRQLKES